MTKVKKSNLNVLGIRTSVVVECLRLCTSMQGAQVRSLVGKFHVPLDADKKKKDKHILRISGHLHHESRNSVCINHLQISNIYQSI